MTFYQPSRDMRRRLSGKPCLSCGLTLHHRDVWAYRHGIETVYAHGACFELLVNAAAAQAEEDAQAAAPAEQANPLDAETLSVQEAHDA